MLDTFDTLLKNIGVVTARAARFSHNIVKLIGFRIFTSNRSTAHIMNPTLRSSIQEASKTAEEFTKLYYESLDGKRHQISRLYLDNGVSVWNGNGITGKDNIQIFYQNLPTAEHTVVSCDAQPVLIDENNQKTMLISVAGQFRVQGKPAKQFQQSFMICTQADKWKIVNDSFRIQDALCTESKSN